MYSRAYDCKMTVCMIVPLLPPAVIGGAERQAIRLAHALQEDGIVVKFVTMGRRRDPFYSYIDGIPTYRLYSPFHSMIFWLCRLLDQRSRMTPIEYERPESDVASLSLNRRFTIAEIMHAVIFMCSCLHFFLNHYKRLDLVHIHTVEWLAPVATLIGALFDKPVLIKDSTMNGFSKLNTLWCGRWIKHWVAQKACFIAISKKIYENLRREGVPAVSITHIPNGIIPSRFVSENGEIGQVLFVGNLSQQPAKGVDVLLLAWQEVIRHDQQAKLTIVGDGDLNRFRSYVHEKNIGLVTFVGRQDHVDAWYQRASIFVLPSRREGLSNALLEAMSHGLSIVATDISGNQDMIQNNVNGLLVPPDDPQRLAEAILFYLRNPRVARSHGRLARSTVITKCDMKEISRKYRKLYTRLVAAHA